MKDSEPVAWMEYIQGEEWEVWFVEPTDLPKGHTYKPLYLHPIKELTDEEIWALWSLFDPSEEVWVSDEQVQGFAREILKKAQEK